MQRTLSAQAIGKSFGDFRAIDGVSVDFFAGEIHAVLGENGAGKSTLMRILVGELLPTDGRIEFPSGPKRIGMVHQHFMLVPAFSVEENLTLASRASTFLCRPAQESKLALDLAAALGWPVKPRAITGRQPIGSQQRIELLKVLADGAEILILDEPTAVLSQSEIADLFRVLRRLRDEGRTVILIAHKLSEVLSIGDRFTVLRNGRIVGAAPRSEVEANELAYWMVGDLPTFEEPPASPSDETVLNAIELKVDGDRGEAAIRSITFRIGAGEILGIGGVDGNGQVELAEAMAGIRTYQGRLDCPPTVAYIPQDRHRDGLALKMSVLENLGLSLTSNSTCVRRGFLITSALRDRAIRLARQFNIRASSLDQPAYSLSGGNQQKVVVARNLEVQPDLIVAVNPTRGLDLAATAEVHQRIRQFAASGSAVALISTDIEELAVLAHRSLVLSRGKLHEFVKANTLVGGLD